MSFFKPEDLENGKICNNGPASCLGQATKMANAKRDDELKHLRNVLKGASMIIEAMIKSNFSDRSKALVLEWLKEYGAE